MKKIAVVVPSYEDNNFLIQCMRTLWEFMGEIEYEIVIVDNASKKPDVVLLLDELETNKNVLVVRNRANLGFARAVNQGIAVLNKTSIDFDFFLVLNQDSSLMDLTIHAALDLMDQNQGIGLCGPRLYNSDGTIQNSFYSFPSPVKILAQLAGMKKLNPLFRKGSLFSAPFFLPSFAANYLSNYKESMEPIEVPWITGACLLIRKKVLDSILGFDENIWMYAEDMDFCFRVRKMGWAIVYCPDWHVYHHGWKPVSLLSKELLKAYYDSLNYFYSKHFHGVKKKCMLFLNKLEKTKALKSRRRAGGHDI
ncbi:glycosyltransferase family 2 protein [Acidobacteriota bacterium]